MKSPYLLLLLSFLCLFAKQAMAQPICGFDIVHANRMKLDPEYRTRVQAGELNLRNYIRQHPELRIHRAPAGSTKTVTGGGQPQTLGGSYQIPVVVHVIHTGGDIGSIYNPDDEQIIGAINYLNQVYNGTWPGTVTSGYGAGNLGIQFVLAQRDPNCNPTNGINRVDGSGVAGYTSGGVNNSTTLGTNEINIKNLSRWDNTQYYNIWIVNKIDGNDGTSGQYIAGYAYLPGASSSLDGIVMLATQMVAGQKTLPHEMGHAFWLYHPFQGSTDQSQCPPVVYNNCSQDGDLICDTDPISYNINSSTGVINFTPRTGTNPCSGNPYTAATESNYMNYTTSYTLFTPDQALRLQATTVSSYRSSLTTSLGGTPPDASCGPKIDFQLQGDRETEITAATSGCRSYRDYTYNMVIGTGPSADATVTLAVNSGGTAVQGLDFDITTNGSFSSPSQQLVFPSGSTTSQSFTIRIYDDASVNGTRTATIGFTVNNGGGNAVAGDGRPTFTLTIDDNDRAPTVGASPNGLTPVGTVAGQYSYSPFDASQASQRTQFLYRAAELTAAGIPAGTLSGLSLYIGSKGSVRAFTNLYIKLGATTTSYLYNAGSVTIGTPMTTVRSIALYNTTAGWNTFSFDVPFTWDGTSNIVVEVCYDNGTASSSDAVDQPLVILDNGNGVNQGNMYWQAGVPCWESFTALSGASVYKPYVQFSYGVSPTVIQSALNSQSQYLGPNADVYFYDPTSNQLMARIQNLSSFNYGCTQVVIDRAGTTATAFQNNTAANYLMDKTFHVLPTTNNASGSYNITLYYTQAEVQGWQTATGQTLSAIQLVKTPGQISAATPSTPDGAGTPTIVTPTISSLGTNTGLTYNFTNGFSGFGAGVPIIAPLPITLLRFTGRLDNQNAVLSWSTSTEQNSAGFDVLRAEDGLHFSKIGYVPAAGNSNTEKDYSYTDPSLTMDSNFYQLKEVSLDGSATYSNVVLVRYPHATPYFTVVPNPFTTSLDILFGKVPTSKVEIRLLDVTGRELLRQSAVQSTGARVHIDIAGPALTPGIYLLQVNSTIQRIIKE